MPIFLKVNEFVLINAEKFVVKKKIDSFYCVKYEKFVIFKRRIYEKGWVYV